MIKLTILNIYFYIYLICCIVISIYKWPTFEEAGNFIYMAGLIFFGISGLGIDYILRKSINDRKLLNYINFVLIVGFSVVLLLELQLNRAN